MTHYYIGWDVGAWNCDEGDSRDALCVLEYTDNAPRLVGSPWRANLRDDLVTHKDSALIQAILEKCGQKISSPASVTIAIDTPLGWPSPMLALLHSGNPCNVPREADSNPYLFRRTELRLFQHDARPLSCVRDMIGSQSTKGLHALRKCGLVSSADHVWRSQDKLVRAIEQYMEQKRGVERTSSYGCA